MNEEFEKGEQIGELNANIKNIEKLLITHINKQDDWNIKMDSRVKLVEGWIQTTTGKVVILTAVISGIGWVAWQVISWLADHYAKIK